jgi:hypothetical protein
MCNLLPLFVVCLNSQLLIDRQSILFSLSAVVYILENIARRAALRASRQKRHHIEAHSDVHQDPHREVTMGEHSAGMMAMTCSSTPS